MAKRSPLGDLSRRLPTPPEVKSTLNSLREAPDQVAVIVGTSIVEALLERLIIGWMKHKTKDLESRLFGMKGPLSDFNSKILISVAFGIITPGMGEELHRLRAIRNVFAHAKQHVTFDTPEISAEADRFIMLNAMSKHAIDEGREDVPLNGKAGFLYICQVMCIIIDGWHDKYFGSRLMER
ncbi:MULTISPECIES: hypothetical protein [unclassified Inquilinus]|uniref:hypothetical protein n=1 Tax=unclassified Inquilinus TaxID=2645927 RepID=UPI003F90F0F6